jgi:hypothetical protein
VEPNLLLENHLPKRHLVHTYIQTCQPINKEPNDSVLGESTSDFGGQMSVGQMFLTKRCGNKSFGWEKNPNKILGGQLR